MECTTCHAIVEVNNTGICLGCQCGFTQVPQSDQFDPPPDQFDPPTKQKTEKINEKTNERIDAIQKPSPKKVPVCHKSTSSRGVRKSNSQGKKVAKKGTKKT